MEQPTSSTQQQPSADTDLAALANDGTNTFKEAVLRKCKFYFDLRDIMMDRVPTIPWCSRMTLLLLEIPTTLLNTSSLVDSEALVSFDASQQERKKHNSEMQAIAREQQLFLERAKFQHTQWLQEIQKESSQLDLQAKKVDVQAKKLQRYHEMKQTGLNDNAIVELCPDLAVIVEVMEKNSNKWWQQMMSTKDLFHSITDEDEGIVFNSYNNMLPLEKKEASFTMVFSTNNRFLLQPIE